MQRHNEVNNPRDELQAMGLIDAESSAAQQQDDDDDDEDQPERASADPDVIRENRCDVHDGSCAQAALMKTSFAARFRSDGR